MHKIKSQHFFERYVKFIHYCQSAHSEGYKEKHHIIPKSLGGTDDINNIIELTGRQHFIAHHLLWKSYQNKEMTLAFWSMKMNKRFGKISSKTYNLLKEQHSHYQSVHMKTFNPMFSVEAKNKVSQYRKGKSLSYDTKKKISDSSKGIPKKESTKRKISMSLKGKQKSEIHKLRLSKNHYDCSGSNNPMYGRSAVKEKNLKWYTNGTENKFITEDTQPAGWIRGRTKIINE